MRFKFPHIMHAVVVLILEFSFYTKDPGGIGDTLNIFLFLDFSLSSVLEVGFVESRWDTALESNMLMAYNDADSLL